MQVTSYTPSSYEYGGALAGFTTHPLPSPIQVGGASLGDDSDASYVTLRAHFESVDPDASGEDSDLVSCHFPPVGAGPLWWHIAFRARNNTQGYDFGTDSGVRRISRADDPTRSVIQSVQSIGAGITEYAVPSPTWFAWAFTRSDPILPGDPGYDTNWSSVDDYAGLSDALTTSGVQVTFTTTSVSDARYDWLDLFEVRLVIASAATAPPYIPPTRVTPSLRMLQRGGSGGMSGIPRMVGDPTRRGIRQGPGSIY